MSSRIIITGAASGIGRAAARLINADVKARTGESARLVMADFHAQQLADAAEELRGEGATVETAIGDLAEPAVCEAIVAQAERAFGGLEAIVSNAGIMHRARLAELSLEQYEHAFAVNTRPTWLLAKHAYPMLKQSRGCIVATTSLAAHDPAINLGAYSASKAALLMLVRQLANDWGPDGIRANSVSPGSTRTNIVINSAMATTQPPDRIDNPLRSMGQPEDPAAAITFLLSPAARYITGVDLSVDGGRGTMLLDASGIKRGS